MADKSFYLSELALEMLVASQNEEKVIIPTSGVLGNSDLTALHKELYSLVSNGIVINNTEANCFDINNELAPIFKSIFSSKAILKVAESSELDNPTYYYLAPCGIAQLKNSSLRKCVAISYIDIAELTDSILADLNLPGYYQNLKQDTDMFIKTVDESFDSNNNCCISPKMISVGQEEFKKQFEEAVGFVDLILREDLSVSSRMAVCKRSVYYKIVQLSVKDVSIRNYGRINFDKAIETMTGEFL